MTGVALGALVRVAWRIDRRAVVVLAGFLLAGAVSHGLVGVFLRELTDAATRGLLGPAAVQAVAAGAALAAGVALGRAELALMQELAERMGLAVQEEILALTASLPTIEHLERPAYLDRLRTLREESRELYFAVWALALVAEHALQIGLGVVLLAAVHPLLPLLLGAAVLPSLLVRGRAAARIDAATSSTAETARLELSLSETATSAGAAKDLRLGGAGEVLDAMAGRHWDAVSDELGRARLRAGLLTFAGSATFLAGYVAALAHAAWLAGRGQATAGDVVLVATVGVQFVTQAARLAFHLGSAAAGRHAATRLAWLRAYAAARHQDRGAAAPPPVLRGGITLAGLSFTYPGTSREVLHDLDLHLPAGATVALVGTHGSGKTTLVKLLCGLHRPSRGTILVDGRPLGDLAQDAWQARVGAVFQDHVRFELTAGETVGVGDLPKLRDPAAVAGALERADAGQVVAGLPQGLETELGETFEHGVRLSGGQWQRLALARGSMRTEPLLLVLDEPTAALDAPAESAVFARYAEAAKGHPGAVTLLITHRFPTVRMADLIVVLGEGRIVQCGTHDRLSQIPGPYADLLT
ncbi:ATP-binding cassette domain-containing protein [Nonomuraea salmonea]|uniref:ATP-binding cassette domain-containing protein n=1 Tax=Nonomuraea salmonea TaxID=46181 RepID=A0ABV5NJF5_9ACTN